jgi:hypothetical protein
MQSFFRGFGRVVIPALIVVGVVALTGGRASATEDPPLTYRIGVWTCQAVPGDPMRNPCVLDSDPAGDPVSVEPDNSPVTLRDVMDAADPDIVQEDEPGFDCRTGGNGVCGPGSDHPAGCYNRKTAAFIAPWRDEWYGVWRPRECGRPTARDIAQQARLNGDVGQLCADSETGGVVCWTVDQRRPKVATGPSRNAP